ncbi:MAG TPA: DUF4097 family beta strand repeat-containing protein [Thermoanaerobaculia bacterium]|jgi:hypothetical protein
MLLAAACGEERTHGASDRTVTISRTWPATAVHALRVFEVNGSISVDASPGDAISLTATVHGRDVAPKQGVENQGLFETRLDGDVLSIGRKREEKHGLHIPMLFGSDEVQIDYVLHVPPSVTLDASTVNGRIATRGVEGETEATTVNGTIDVESAGISEVRATTVNGKVKAKFLRGFEGARLKTVNGGVTAWLPASASFSVDLAQMNGDFEAAFPLSIHSDPGRRRVSGTINGGDHELKIVTVNGDVELEKLGGGGSTK